MINDFEYCRKSKYSVKIELGCYKIDDQKPLIAGFEEKNINGERYAIKKGVNRLEKNEWETSPERPYIVTGTVEERWAIKPKNLAAYDVVESELSIFPKKVFTKDPSNQEFLVAKRIPLDQHMVVVPSYAFRDDGTIDEKSVFTSNLPAEGKDDVGHLNGDYVIAKEIEGKPNYWDLPEEIRNTKEVAELYDPRIINGSVMENTYDHAKTKEEIKAKYVKPTTAFLSEEETKKQLEEASMEEEIDPMQDDINKVIEYFTKNPTSQELPREAQRLMVNPLIDGKALVEQARRTGIARSERNSYVADDKEIGIIGDISFTEEPNKELDPVGRSRGFAKVWILGFLTASISIGILILGVLLTK